MRSNRNSFTLLFYLPWLPALLALPAAVAAPEHRAAVLKDAALGMDGALAEEAAAAVRQAGYAVQLIDAGELLSRERLLAGGWDLLVLPWARRLPLASARVVEEFLKAGGDLIALGLPAWSEPLERVGGKWRSAQECEAMISSQKAEHLIFDFDSEDLARWTRNTNDPSSKSLHQLDAEPGVRGRALHVVIENLTGWDTFASPPLARPFPEGHSLTCLFARGGPAMRQLALEWIEEDGSRWIATVDLTPEWKSYALPPEAFRPWQPPPGRGGKGDRLKVSKAARFTAGLAQTHTAAASGRQEYWLDEVGTASHPLGEVPSFSEDGIPRLEGLSPEYLFYPVTLPVTLRTPEGLALVGEIHSPAPRSLLALHPRPGGAGYNQEKPWRWQPLLEARSQDGEHRGAVAALLVHATPPFRGAAVAAFTPVDPSLYRQDSLRRVMREVAIRMRQGVFLKEGGCEFYTVFEGQRFQAGARAVNFGTAEARGLEIAIEVTENGQAGKPVARQAWRLDLPAGAEEKRELAIEEKGWPATGLRVAVELRQEGAVLDRLGHEIHVWRPKAKPAFIEARDGGFWLEGRPWKAHGVNYMPSSGIGVADGNTFEHWLGRGAYDPEVIERDLRRIKAMNMNAVSVFIYHRSVKAQHLLDFLRRSEALGLRVNQSLRPGTPMDFRRREMEELIEYYRMAKNDTIFAYDLAWEPSHHDHRHQKSYASAWRAWVEKRYGSLAAAEKNWGALAPRDGGQLAVPPMEQLVRDGAWRRLIADYRRFLDELIGEKYREARRLVKSLVPNHPVSFRMQFAGDPTQNWDRLLPYDFAGLAEAVDIWEPEAYGRIGGWEKVRPGHFTAAYARLCDPEKPILWAEVGYDVWDARRKAPLPEKLDFAARYFRDFYRMLGESGADGIFFWWYPGGFRLNEGSDFGIINSDGTLRPETEVIRAEGLKFLSAPKPPPPGVWIEVDRDRDARGLFGIYEAVKDEYWKAVEAGKRPGLRLKGGARPGS
ncbi:MAG: beta-galactosidase [Planctomycetes bacterium]|nr:beta-galactosidase [Planctomycetota bacterium]